MNPLKIQEMLSQAGEMRQQVESKLSEVVVEGSAGAGAVSVQMNGHKQLLRVKIDPSAVLGLSSNKPDVEMLEDLITSAVNDAGRKADEAIKGTLGGTLGKLMSGLGLPGA
jgi:hypothetical protein